MRRLYSSDAPTQAIVSQPGSPDSKGAAGQAVKLGIPAKAHIVGLSMGAFATFYFGMKWPERALSLTLAGIGSGSMPEARARFRQESEAAAAKLLAEGWEKSAAVRGQLFADAPCS